MFGKFDANFLKKCVGTNTIFVSSPTQSMYENTIDPEVRVNIERFCGDRLKAIIQLIQPRGIVVIGFETMKHIVRSKIIAESASDPEYGPKGAKALWEIRDFGGRKVLATFHLTGGQGYTTKEREMVADRIWQDVEADRRKAV